MSTAEVRRRVKREFELQNVSLRVDALNLAAECCVSKTPEQIREYVKKIVDRLIVENVEDEIIDIAILKQCHARLARGKNSQNAKVFEVINATAWKKELLDPITKSYKEIKRQDVSAEQERFELIKKNVTTPNVLPLELLFSRSNTVVTVLAMLRRDTMSSYAIEDPTGFLKINLNGAIFEDGIFFEGGIYMFNGLYKNNMLEVKTVSLPALRPEPMIRRRRSDLWDESEMIAVFSEVWLDSPVVLKKINSVLSGFADFPPYAFVFCGNFLSPKSTTDPMPAMDKGFRHLNNIIDQYQEQYANTQFVFVPSSQDLPTSKVFPRAPVAHGDHFRGMSNVHFASNPCKLQCRDVSIIIFREDNIFKACTNAIRVAGDKAEIPNQFVKTVRSQKHYSPLPLYVTPVVPKFDYLFELSPEPDVLILADDYQQYIIDGDSNSRPLVFNPGSFATSEKFEFITYNCKRNKADSCEIPE
uniref:DNA polymerase II subunit 2 n=1 Tax=Panagrellus redivivus TaxID=6233 RepID=A0A7E4UN24_PANRE